MVEYARRVAAFRRGNVSISGPAPVLCNMKEVYRAAEEDSEFRLKDDECRV